MPCSAGGMSKKVGGHRAVIRHVSIGLTMQGEAMQLYNCKNNYEISLVTREKNLATCYDSLSKGLC